VEAWQIVVEGEVDKIGTREPGLPPTLLPAAAAAIDGLEAGGDVEGAAGALGDAERSLGAAIDALSGYALVEEIRGEGFDITQTNYLLNSKTKMVEALRIYRQAVVLGTRALGGAAELGGISLELRDRATTMFADGWNDLERVKQTVGISPAPGGIVP